MQAPDATAGVVVSSGDDRPCTANDKPCSQAAATATTPCDSAAEANRLRQEVWLLENKVQKLEQAMVTVETSRNDLVQRQTKCHGNIVKLQSTVNSLEEREANHLAQITSLQDENRSLKQQLAASELLLGMTPDKCRASQQSLQHDLLRVSKEAQRHEHHVRRLRLLVLSKVRDADEALRFAEVERSVLLAANDGLVEELAAARGLLQEQHAELEAAQMASGQLAVRLEEALRQVEALRAQEGTLQAAAATARAEADAAAQMLQVATTEREQATANLRCAESELAGVQSLGTVMFRQVKGILHQLESHLGLYHTRELATIVRQLRDWVARNGLAWEGDGLLPTPLPSPAPAKTPRMLHPEGGPLVPISVPQSTPQPRPVRFVC